MGCISGDDELTKENGSIAVVGKDQKFMLLEGDALQPYLDRLEVTRAEEKEDDDDEEDDDAAAGGDEPQAMET